MSGNMSYCRFENTFNDLEECYNYLNEAGNIDNLENMVNNDEKTYIRKLIELCREIADEFDDGE